MVLLVALSAIAGGSNEDLEPEEVKREQSVAEAPLVITDGVAAPWIGLGFDLDYEIREDRNLQIAFESVRPKEGFDFIVLNSSNASDYPTTEELHDIDTVAFDIVQDHRFLALANIDIYARFVPVYPDRPDVPIGPAVGRFGIQDAARGEIEVGDIEAEFERIEVRVRLDVAQFEKISSNAWETLKNTPGTIYTGRDAEPLATDAPYPIYILWPKRELARTLDVDEDDISGHPEATVADVIYVLLSLDAMNELGLIAWDREATTGSVIEFDLLAWPADDAMAFLRRP